MQYSVQSMSGYFLGARFPPFFDQDITNTYKKIVEGRFMFPTYFPPVARDLVRKLLQVYFWNAAKTLPGVFADAFPIACNRS